MVFIPWSAVILIFNAFHNKIKKINKKVRVSTELGTYIQTKAINKERLAIYPCNHALIKKE